MPALLDRICRDSCGLLDAAFAAVHLIDNRHATLRAFHPVPPDPTLAGLQATCQAAANNAVQTGKMICTGLADDELGNGAGTDKAPAISLPMTGTQGLLGTLSVVLASRRRALDTDETQFFEMVAVQAASILEVVRIAGPYCCCANGVAMLVVAPIWRCGVSVAG